MEWLSRFMQLVKYIPGPNDGDINTFHVLIMAEYFPIKSAVVGMNPFAKARGAKWFVSLQLDQEYTTSLWVSSWLLFIYIYHLF